MGGKKLIRAALVCLLFGLMSCGSFAVAKAGELKIGVMNVQKVLVMSEAGQKAKGKFDSKRKELEEKFKGEQAALIALQQEIEKKSSVWSKEKKDEKVLEYNKMGRDLQTKTEDARQDMKRLQDKELEPILKALETVVDNFGEKNGYTIILDSKNSVIYFDEAHDVSDAIIVDLNKAMK